jgi:hypothetical protein
MVAPQARHLPDYWSRRRTAVNRPDQAARQAALGLGNEPLRRILVNRTLTLMTVIAVLLAGCAAGNTGAPIGPDPYYQGASSCTDCRK